MSSASAASFFASAAACGSRLALVTSGGTAAPLERPPCTVRFLVNFSTGARGAYLCEALLRRGYAVVLLCRAGSAQPFTAGAHAALADALGSLGPAHGLAEGRDARVTELRAALADWPE